jgi:hypothetical protein
VEAFSADAFLSIGGDAGILDVPKNSDVSFLTQFYGLKLGIAVQISKFLLKCRGLKMMGGGHLEDEETMVEDRRASSSTTGATVMQTLQEAPPPLEFEYGDSYCPTASPAVDDEPVSLKKKKKGGVKYEVEEDESDDDDVFMTVRGPPPTMKKKTTSSFSSVRSNPHTSTKRVRENNQTPDSVRRPLKEFARSTNSGVHKKSTASNE